MDRSTLPYRKNCEIYVFTEGTVLAQKREGYLEFPGGGIDDGEEPAQAISRECYEETGIAVKKIKFLQKIRFDWDKNWAKTKKQKRRYQHYRGEEMHLFSGEITTAKQETNTKQNNEWQRNAFMPIAEAITFMEQQKPSEELKEYYNYQLRTLKKESCKKMKTKTRVAALIVRNGNLLLVKGPDKFKEYWTPGGRLEKGETQIPCLRRELKEELNVDLDSYEFFGEYQRESPYFTNQIIKTR